MYLPDMFRQEDRAAAMAVVEDYPFAVVVSRDPSLEIAHVPMIAEPGGGALLGHVARANPLAERILAGTALTAVFTGPHAYVSPTWYVSARMVPTWNFVAVHVSGTAEPITERAALAELVEDLADFFERDRDDPWIPDYPEAMLDAIVGFRLPVERLDAKFKLSQNRGAADRAGVVAALEAGGDGERAVAAMMKTGESAGG